VQAVSPNETFWSLVAVLLFTAWEL